LATACKTTAASEVANFSCDAYSSAANKKQKPQFMTAKHSKNEWMSFVATITCKWSLLDITNVGAHQSIMLNASSSVIKRTGNFQ